MLCNSYKNSHFLETSIWSTVSWLSSLLFPKPQALTVSNDVIFSSSECPLPVLMKLFPFIFCFCDIYKNIELAYSSFSTHIHLERMDLTSFTLVLHWINDRLLRTNVVNVADVTAYHRKLLVYTGFAIHLINCFAL